MTSKLFLLEPPMLLNIIMNIDHSLPMKIYYDYAILAYSDRLNS